MKKHMIWSSEIDIEDWKDYLESEHPDVTDEYEKYRLCSELNDSYLDDERINLRVDLHREIIAIGHLQRWNGRVTGYKEIKGTCISDCLCGTCGDYVSWYVDERYDLVCEDAHHDGTNHYLYRVFKKGVSDTQKENFKCKIYDGKVTRADINRYTERLGDKIDEVYGWNDAPKRGNKIA